MKIALYAAEDNRREIVQLPGVPELMILDSHPGRLNAPDADIYLNLHEGAEKQDYGQIHIPVFIHSVTGSLSSNQLPAQVVRINAWPGFLQRPVWEYAGILSEGHQRFMQLVGKKAIAVADQPGFVAARILALIINEACYAEGEGVSTEKDIDIAMTLGTNYPAGPFDWAQRIGWRNILALLQELSVMDERYKPSAGLVSRAML